MTFEDFKISKKIKKVLLELNYQTPSPIQEQAIPVLLEGSDVLGCAQTGTGKTCAFMVPIINSIVTQTPKKGIKALVLTPTRELAIQIYENTVAYSRYSNVKSLAIFGGVKEGLQKQRIKSGVDILIATPGRLIDFVNQKVVDLRTVEFFVLDEADRMLDMGFVKDVNKIISLVPKKRQTMLFSATMPDSIKEICDRILVNPVHITITPPSTTVEAINQTVYMVDKANKMNLLCDLIKEKNMFSALVFSRTKHGADKICKYLVANKISADAIHGNKSQNARQKALKDFKQNKIQVLVATDIAARGIDIDFLSHVINFDLPEVSESYVHRIGRTARAGRSGDAISFCCIDEVNLLRDIEKDCKIKIEVNENHNYKMKVFEKSPPKQRGRQSNKDNAVKKETNNNPKVKRYKKKY